MGETAQVTVELLIHGSKLDWLVPCDGTAFVLHFPCRISNLAQPYCVSNVAQPRRRQLFHHLLFACVPTVFLGILPRTVDPLTVRELD